MENKWRACRLGNVLTLQRGMDLPVQKREAGNIPVVASTGIVGFHSKAAVKGAGVVIGRSGSIGGGQFIGEDFWPLNTTLWVKDFHGNNPRYCYYLLKSMDFSGLNAGSGVPTLNRNHLHPLPVICPPLPDQHAIAQILGALDDKIELNRRMNQTLEGMAQALFQSWFVDFDGISKKDRQQSELGLIPKGWRVGTLADLCELKYGKALKSTQRRSGEIPVYGSGGITGWHDEALVTKPTIIVGRKGTVGSLYWQSASCFPIDTVFYVEPKISLLFCYYAMLRMGLHTLNTDAAVPGLNRDNAYRQTVVIPQDDALKKWDAIAADIRARMDSANQQSRTLAHLRDTLLPHLISGKLRLQGLPHES